MDKELISVIVPVYNVENYLPRCLDSIANQTYRNLEIILVDDGSTDRSGLLCDEFAEKDYRARVIHEKNMGTWFARNVGKDAASGDYLFFPDADDFFHVDTIRVLHEAINYNCKQYSLSICGIKQSRSFEEDIRKVVSPLFSFLTKDHLLNILFSRYNETEICRFFSSVCNKLFRVSALEGIHFRNYVFGEDRDFLMRLFLKVEGAVFVGEKLYFYYQRPGSVTKTHDAPFQLYSCEVRMSYTNYKELTTEQHSYRHYFLHFLYRRMVFYKNVVYKSDKQVDVFKMCKNYERDTLKDYLTCGHECILSKLLIVALLHSPSMTRLLMKLTNNN